MPAKLSPAPRVVNVGPLVMLTDAAASAMTALPPASSTSKVPLLRWTRTLTSPFVIEGPRSVSSTRTSGIAHLHPIDRAADVCFTVESGAPPVLRDDGIAETLRL